MKDTDFRLYGLEPADEHTADLYDSTWVSDFKTISQHDVGERSFIVAFDASATWGYPNMPNLASFDVVRDSSQATFSMRRSEHATFAFAQNWLVNRGCPPDKLAPIVDVPKPADELTIQVEDRIRNSGERLEIVDYQVIDGDDTEGWSIAVDRQDKDLPVRLFIEELQPDPYTYTVREGAFADHAAAESWLEDRSTPLPEAPEYRVDAEALRKHAALARTTSLPPMPSPAPAAPAAHLNTSKSLGRSL
ncbi:glycosyl hydrolase [Streptomyces sp. SP17BM10]|uniref:glycosyl hydrolase n=1 Tax=Streptomyces sp. SP17BM10 TaxID=3002530 RepID=UPI002E77825F|nr:glycosyl hydrolase [Streptomyces sp. SP17BM10]MEE1786916.1 glycosyl hydrolase [Streptomyces sp. SP17BM10]